MILPARVLAAGALAGILAGCSVGYVFETYSSTSPVNVDLSCRQSFQLFEHAGLRRFLVKPYPVSEAAYLACAAISRDEMVREGPARAREAVERHFEKVAPTRPHCRTTGVAALGALEYEVSYDCTPPKPGTARPPGRG